MPLLVPASAAKRTSICSEGPTWARHPDSLPLTCVTLRDVIFPGPPVSCSPFDVVPTLAQYQQLGILRRRRTCQQHHPSGQADEDQVEHP